MRNRIAAFVALPMKSLDALVAEQRSCATSGGSTARRAPPSEQRRDCDRNDRAAGGAADAPEDLPRLAKLLDAERLPSGDLGEPGVRLFAFRDGGAVVGFAGLEVYGKDALLRSVVVDPARRRAGLGRADRRRDAGGSPQARRDARLPADD